MKITNIWNHHLVSVLHKCRDRMSQSTNKNGKMMFLLVHPGSLTACPPEKFGKQSFNHSFFRPYVIFRGWSRNATFSLKRIKGHCQPCQQHCRSCRWQTQPITTLTYIASKTPGRLKLGGGGERFLRMRKQNPYQPPFRMEAINKKPTEITNFSISSWVQWKNDPNLKRSHLGAIKGTYIKLHLFPVFVFWH